MTSNVPHRSGTHRLCGPTRVLIIDDSDLARTALRARLTAAGIEVFEQSSAIGAIRNIRRHTIDVVLLDVSMPGLSGDKLATILRANPRLQGLLIVLVSAKPWEELQELGATTGADAVISKDQVDQELVDLIRLLVATHTTQAGDNPWQRCVE